MSRIPEPDLQPPECAQLPLRCCLCLRIVPEALELYGRIVCRSCLQKQSIDDLSALLCAPILTEESPLSQGGTR